MIAALPMYDRPELAGAHHRFWAEIARALPFGAPALTQPTDLWALWTSPDLLLAQTCGFPYRARLIDRQHLVGTPDYGLPDAPPGRYYSVLITRSDDPAQDVADLDGASLAYNEPMSQSGWAAVYTQFRAANLTIGPRHPSGAHRTSARMVADGTARFAAIDAVTWALMRRYDRFTDDLKVLGHTAPTPGLPLITALPDKASILAEATTTAITALPPEDREALMIKGLVQIPAADYAAVPTPPAP